MTGVESVKSELANTAVSANGVRFAVKVGVNMLLAEVGSRAVLCADVLVV